MERARRWRWTAILMMLALALAACGDDGGAAPGDLPLDGEDDSFGIGKADEGAGGFSVCELREVLKLVNESTTTSALLVNEIKVHKRASDNLVAHRVGPDKVAGTRDDDLFDDLKELDDVSYVGKAALEALAVYARPRCVIDLTTRPFIHEGTFSGSTGGGWGRNAPEFEATLTVTGATGRELLDVVSGKDSKGRSMFSRLRKNELMEAFTYNYDIDEMPWDSDSTEAREMAPYLALSIESGRYEVDAEDDSGVRELSLGTDIFDDIYYDTTDYELLSLGSVLRGRARWDDDSVVRRLLIQAKSATTIDENSIKTSAKVDVRTDSGDRFLKDLDNDVRTGTVAWTGSRVPVEPIRILWEDMDKNGRLKDIGGFRKVMLLDPKANLRSVRSRIHYNLADQSRVDRFYENGIERMRFANELAQKALDDGIVADADKQAVQELIVVGQAILDHSLITERSASRLAALEPSVTSVPAFPEDFLTTSPGSQHDLDALKIVAETSDVVLDEYADLLDDLDRSITGTRGLDGDDYVDWYIAFVKFEQSSLKAKRTARPFLDRYAAVNTAGGTELEGHMAAFNTYGTQQKDSGNKDFKDFAPVDATLWGNLGKHLTFEVLKVSQRMITNGGTAALGQWFHVARKFYVPNAFASSFSNFIIDTFDVSYYLTPEEWARIGDDQRKPGGTIDPAAMFHTTIVNEVQIELTSIEPYVKRVDALKAELATASTPEKEAELAGARFILEESIRTLQVIGELKGPEVIDELEGAGLKKLKWEPARFSKGETALRILTDTD